MSPKYRVVGSDFARNLKPGDLFAHMHLTNHPSWIVIAEFDPSYIASLNDHIRQELHTSVPIMAFDHERACGALNNRWYGHTRSSALVTVYERIPWHDVEG